MRLIFNEQTKRHTTWQFRKSNIEVRQKKKKQSLYTYLMFDDKSIFNFSKAIFRNEKMNFNFIFSNRFFRFTFYACAKKYFLVYFPNKQFAYKNTKEINIFSI